MRAGHYSLPLFLLLASGAQAVEFNTVQPARSTVAFAYKQMNVPMEGRFNKFSASIMFDPEKTHAAKATIEVDLASIDTGFSESNDEVAGKLWFNTRTFPVAQFVSGGVKTLGNNRFEASGKLSIKGKVLDVVAPFTFKQEGQLAAFDGAFNLKRLDYAIGEGIWSDLSTVANEIQIKFRIVAEAAPTKKQH